MAPLFIQVFWVQHRHHNYPNGFGIQKTFEASQGNHAIICTNVLGRKSKLFSMVCGLRSLTTDFFLSLLWHHLQFPFPPGLSHTSPGPAFWPSLKTTDPLDWLSTEFSFLPWHCSSHWFLFVLPISIQVSFPWDSLYGSSYTHTHPPCLTWILGTISCNQSIGLFDACLFC